MPRVPTQKRRKHAHTSASASSDPNRDIAYVWVDTTTGSIMYRGAYKRTCVTDLKSKIPSSSRRWLEDMRIWSVDPSYIDVLLKVLRDHYASVVEPPTRVGVGGREARDRTQPPPGTTAVATASRDPYSVVLRLAKPETMKRIFRMIALDVHPDHGGTTDDMTTLNQAWKQITEADKRIN